MLISTKELSKTFDNYQALKPTTWQLNKGEVWALLGPNGAGKTTFIRLLASLLPPSTGNIAYLGNQKIPNNFIGYLPEERGLYKKMTVTEQLYFWLNLRGFSKNEIKNISAFWIDKLILNEVADKDVQLLSKGNQQKVQLALTLIHNPEVIILDEPFTGFDPINASLLEQIIQEQQELGKGLIISTHRMEQAEQLCSHAMLLNKGELLLHGKMDEIKNQYSNHQQFKVKGRGELKSNKTFQFISKTKNEKLIELNTNLLFLDLVQELQTQSFEIEGINKNVCSLNDLFKQLITK